MPCIRLRRRRRGVSPIIATILLVAITVVLAAVLYILITGLFGGAPAKAVEMGFGPANPSSCVSAAGVTFQTYTVDVVSTSEPVTTSMFGLKVVNASAITVVPGIAGGSSGACTQVGTTGATGGWCLYIRSGGSGSALATFDSTGWKAVGAAQLPITLDSSISIVVVSVHPIDQYQLSTYATGSPPVTGQVTL